VTPLSLELKAKLASVLVVCAGGPLVMKVSGGLVSTVKPDEAWPAGAPVLSVSVATTSWGPSGSGLLAGTVQVHWPELSTTTPEHSVVPSTTTVTVSPGVPEPPMVGVPVFTAPPCAGVSMVKPLPATMLQVSLAGVGSWLPAASTAATWKVCEPTVSPLNVLGSLQAVKAAPSRLQT